MSDKKEKKVYTKEEKCFRGRTALRLGAISVIFAFFALIAYENTMTFSIIPEGLYYKDKLINDSFVIFLILGGLASLFSIFGIFFSITRRSILGFLLSIIIPVTAINYRTMIPDIDLSDISNSIRVDSRKVINKKIENNTTIESIKKIEENSTIINDDVVEGNESK